MPGLRDISPCGGLYSNHFTHEQVRPREGAGIVQGHAGGKFRSQDMNQHLSDSKAQVLTRPPGGGRA